MGRALSLNPGTTKHRTKLATRVYEVPLRAPGHVAQRFSRCLLLLSTSGSHRAPPPPPLNFCCLVMPMGDSLLWPFFFSPFLFLSTFTQMVLAEPFTRLYPWPWIGLLLTARSQVLTLSPVTCGFPEDFSGDSCGSLCVG